MKEPKIRQLRELVERASRDNPRLITRLEKAAFLVLLRTIERLGEHHFRVGSEDGLRYYEVINGHCRCSDYLRHGPGHPCKHRLALSLNQSLGARTKSGKASRSSDPESLSIEDSPPADPTNPVSGRPTLSAMESDEVLS